MTTFPVKLHIYDLSRGLARQMSPILLGKQLDGIWHTGIVVYGKEFYFGSGGIEYCPPCGTILGQPDEIKDMGLTEVPEELFNNYLIALNQDQFRPERYNLFEHNCNTFSNEAAQFLTGQPIPKKIQDLPQEILKTPFGVMIKPMIDSMTVRPNSENSTSVAEAATELESIFEPRPDDGGNSDPPIIDGPKIKLKQSKDVPVMYNNYKISGLISSLNTTIENDHLKEKEICQVKEIEKALQCEDEDKVTESHLKLLENLLEKYEQSGQDVILTNIIQTLGLLVLKDDIISLVCQDPVSKPVFKLAREFSHLTFPDVQCAVVELFTNICSTDVGRFMFVAEEDPDEEQPRSRNASETDDGACESSAQNTDRSSGTNNAGENGESRVKSRSGSLVDHQQAIVDHRDVIQVTVKAILDENKELAQKAAALVYNISMAKVSEESALECASAVLERLRDTDNETETVYRYLFALRNFMKISPEIANLTNVIGIELTKFINISPNIEHICNELEQYLIV